MQRALVSVPGDTPLPDVVRAVRAALDGTGPAVMPMGAATAAEEVPDGVALVLATSGSTGAPRWVLLDADAVRASAHATHDRLGGPGRWVLALPWHHVAGIQVITRSLLAGTEPLVLPQGRFDPFTAAEGLQAALSASSERLYASLVPTQLHRIVAAAGSGPLPAALRAWEGLAGILVGGAATAPALLERARDLGLRVVTSYGMTETAGGCVYDGVPLDGVQVRVAGTIEIAGPVLARGYLGDDPGGFVDEGGVRWFRTADVGEVVDGVLHVHGRADDVIVTGGVNVAPVAVERVLADLDLGEVCVVGMPDAEWGQVVTAVVVPGDGPLPDVDTLRDAVAIRLGKAAAPRAVVVMDRLPYRGPGKVDRAAVAREAAELLTDPDWGRSAGEPGPPGPGQRVGGDHGDRR